MAPPGVTVLILLGTIGIVPLVAGEVSQYIVTAPSEARAGYTYRVSMKMLVPSIPFIMEASILSVHDQVVVDPVSTTFSGIADEQRTFELLIPTDAPTGKNSLRLESKSGTLMKFRHDLDITALTAIINIQIDRLFFKPGQTVKFRAVAMGPDLRPIPDPMDVVILDADQNKLLHKKNLASDRGVIKLEYELSDGPVLGDWTFKVFLTLKPEIMSEETFKVDKYVLPRFSVELLNLPSAIPIFPGTDTAVLNFDVKSMYTYGRPVNGKVVVQVKNGPREYLLDEQTLVNGKVSCTTLVERTEIVNYFRYRPQLSQNIELKVTVTEDLTNKEESTEGTVSMATDKYKIEIIFKNEKTFIYGMPLTIIIKVTQVGGTSIPADERSKFSVRLTFTLSNNWVTDEKLLPSLTLPLPDDDVMSAYVDVPTKAQMRNQTFTMKAVLRYAGDDGDGVETARHYMYPVRTMTERGIRVDIVGATDQVLSPHHVFSAGQQIRVKVMSTSYMTVSDTTRATTVFYEVHARGMLLMSGSIVPPRDTFTGIYIGRFDILITSKMAPTAVILVYTNTDTQEISADSLVISVDGLFKNQVCMSFNKAEVNAGEGVQLSVEGEAGAYIAYLAIDYRSVLQGKAPDINQDNVEKSVKRVFNNINLHDEDNSGGGGGCPMCKRKRRDVQLLPNVYSGLSTDKIIKDAGVIMMTKSLIASVPNILPPMMEDGIIMMAAAAGGAPVNQSPVTETSVGDKPTVRKNFVETWIWRDGSIGLDGTSKLDLVAPDSITSWDVRAFTMSQENGLDTGSCSKTKLTVFKPMFVVLDLPYSLIRGEKFKLFIYAFNYLNDHATIFLTLYGSDEFKVFPLLFSKEILDDGSRAKSVTLTKSIRVPSNSSNGFFVWIVPVKLGSTKIRVSASTTSTSPPINDAVEQIFLTEPEGKRVFNDTARPLQFEELTTIQFRMDAFPNTGEDVVDGSLSTHVTITGDVMGPALDNLNNLVRQPYGCGEQNMITLVPNIFAIKYLAAINKVDEDLRTRAIRNMEMGYQRELTFKHTDGSFSAFGERDASGSTWLTAFVVKSFAMAKQFIYIDEDMMRKSSEWLLRQYDAKSGSFKKVGKVIHQEMKGSGSLSLTAYVTIALQEIEQKMPNFLPNLDYYLQAVLKSLEDDYDADGMDFEFPKLAMYAYAFALGGSSRTTSILQDLQDLAQTEDGMKFWSKDTQTTTIKEHGVLYCSRPQVSSEVETAANVLLAYTTLRDIANGRPIQKYLMSQSSGSGGFGSTQNTVLGLQAMSSFASLLDQGTVDITVDYTAGTETGTLRVNEDNKYLLQKVKLQSVRPVSVHFTVTGTGLALLTVPWSYNVRSTSHNINTDKIGVDTDVVAVTTNIFDIIFTIRLHDQDEIGNMATVEYGPPSGFTTDTSKVLPGVSRIEDKGNVVVMYIDAMQSYQQLRLQSIRSYDVADIVGGTITAGMYYNQQIVKTVTYDLPRELKLSACELSGDLNNECPLPKIPSSAPATAMPTTFLFCLLLAVVMLLKI